MPATVRLFRKSDGSIPVQDWLDDLEVRRPEVYAKFLERIARLAEIGNKMLEHRTHAAHLRDRIYELRVRRQQVHYRILFFFYGKDVVALSHGLTKKGRVPDADIDTAIERRQLVHRSPDLYTADFEV